MRMKTSTEDDAPRQVAATLAHYASAAGAKSYSTKYHEIPHKRLSMRTEGRLLDRALAAMGRRHATLLDMPSGPGRLYPVIAPHADFTVECDYSVEMLKLLRGVALELGRKPGLVSADCFELPFVDRAFEAVVSIRLSHHVPAEENRERYLREILRVCERDCLFTFFDHASVKNRVRRLRSLLGSSKRAKYTMRRERVEAVASECGFSWRESWPLSRLFSGHRFTWLRRREPTPPRLSGGPKPEGLDERLFARLADPGRSQGPLRAGGGRLVRADGAAYPVEDGIPVLHVARLMADGSR